MLVQHFTGTGLPFAIPLFWLITMVLNVALNLTFVPVWGARAAALNSTLSYALIFVLVAVHFCRQTGRQPQEIFLLHSSELRNVLAKIHFSSLLGKVHE